MGSFDKIFVYHMIATLFDSVIVIAIVAIYSLLFSWREDLSSSDVDLCYIGAFFNAETLAQSTGVETICFFAYVSFEFSDCYHINESHLTLSPVAKKVD